MASNKLYLIDGSGFIFRAYHALPALTRADGTPVGAVMGFCNMLVKLRRDFNATNLLVVFDAGRQTFRQQIYADYKAHRPEAPADLVPQFPLLREASRAFGLPTTELAGFEADDLIASYAAAARQAGQEVVIVSGDKDLMQLVGAGVELFDPIKNKILDDAAVVEKFGVPPSKVAEVQALAGDSSDNVPGVPGIGVKTAAELISAFGSLEALLNRTAEIKQPKRRQALEDNAALARISHQLVLLKQDAPLPVPLAECVVREDSAALTEFLSAQGFKQLLARLNLTSSTPSPSISHPALQARDLGDHQIDPVAKPRDDKIKVTYQCITSAAALQHWVEKIMQAGMVAIDTETTSLTPSTTTLVGISLAVAAGDACYIPIHHRSAAEGALDFAASAAPVQLPLASIITALQPVLADASILKIAHNLKFDWQVLAQHGLHINSYDDTMLLSYVLGAGLHGHGLDELAQKYFNHSMISYADVCGSGKNQITFDLVPIDKATNYAAEDADYTWRLWQVLKPAVQQAKLNTLYQRVEQPLVPVIAAMETAGVLIDTSMLQQLAQRFAASQQVLEQDIFKLAGQEFNVGSPKQLGDILFGSMGLPGGVKSKTGAYGTGAEVLEPLAEQGHVIAEKVLEWRALAKLRSTYAEALPQQVSPKTGRVHTSFALAITSTGRLSSSDPNLQNIPIRTADGKAIRQAFIAAPGHQLISVDYSQIELRIVAALAGIGAMIEAFKNNIDIHALTASQVYGVPLASVTKDQRYSAKAINFGIIYGISGFGLGKQIGVSAGEAAAFIKDYLSRFHELRDFMEAQKTFARQNGYVETYFKRRCHVPGITDKNPARRNFAERQAINAPIQGTAADIMKLAMIALPPALAAAGLNAKLLLQVHDELVLEAPADQAEAVAKLAVQTMANVVTLPVPLTAEYGIADNWAGAH